MDAQTWMLLAGIGAGAASSVGGAITSNKARKSEEQLVREKMAQDAALAKQDLASKESMANQFRHQLDQAGAIDRLDLMERGTYKPTVITPPARYAGMVPQFSGGFSYEKSPELVSSAAALKRNVMGGNVAPTMTDPANYGRTGALDLLRIASDGVDPGTVNASGPRRPTGVAPTTTPVDYMAEATRRGGGTGGIMKGAAAGASLGRMGGWYGAAAGGIAGAAVGAFTKKAQTAPTDVDVPTATAVLTRAMLAEQGRSPRPGEIEQMLAGQGLKPGDRWVGEQGLRSLIASLRGGGASMQPSYSAVA